MTSIDRESLYAKARQLVEEDSILSKENLSKELSLSNDEFIAKLSEEWNRFHVMDSGKEKKQPDLFESQAQSDHSEGEESNQSDSETPPIKQRSDSEDFIPKKKGSQKQKSQTIARQSHPKRVLPLNSYSRKIIGVQRHDQEKLEKKRRELQAKLDEYQHQAEKLSSLIEQTESKEKEQRSLLHQATEDSKMKQRLINQEMENTRNTIESMRRQIGEAQQKLEFESQQYKKFMKSLSERKEKLLTQLNKLEWELEEEEQLKEQQKEELQQKIDVVQSEIDEISMQESELTDELQKHKNLLISLKEKEDKALNRIKDIKYTNFDGPFQDMVKQIDRLQIQETNIVLKLETFRQSYPKEMLYVEKERTTRIMTEKYEKEKNLFSEKRLILNKEIDELQNQLTQKEAENETLKEQFKKEKVQEDQYLNRKIQKIQNLKRYIKLRLNQIDELQTYIQELEAMNGAFESQEFLRQQLSEMGSIVIQEEEKRYNRVWNQQHEATSDSLEEFVESYLREYENFQNIAFSVSQNPETDGTMMKKFIETYSQNLNENWDKILKFKEQVAELKKYKAEQQILTEEFVNFPDNNELEEKLAILNRDIVVLENTLRANQNEILQTWKRKIQEDHHNAENLRLVREGSKLMKRVSQSTKLLLETTAEVVIVKKKRLSNAIQQTETTNFEKYMKNELLSKWKTLHERKNKEYQLQWKREQSERSEYIEALKKILMEHVEQIERAERILQESDVEERATALKKKSDSERQRIITLSEHISSIEDKLNSLKRAKKLVEDAITKISNQRIEFEKQIELEKSILEEEFSKVDNQESLLNSLDTLRMLLERLEDIQRVIEKAAEKSSEMQPKEKELFEILFHTRVEIKSLQLKAISTQHATNKLSSSLKELRKAKYEYEEHLNNLFMNEGGNFESSVHSIQEKDISRSKIKQMIKQIDKQQENSSINFSNFAEPTRQGIDEQEKEISLLMVSLQRSKSDINQFKVEWEKTQKKFNQVMSQIRGQRQHLRHRLELKMKAIENINKEMEKQNLSGLSTNLSSVRKIERPRDSELYDVVMSPIQPEDLEKLSPIKQGDHKSENSDSNREPNFTLPNDKIHLFGPQSKPLHRERVIHVLKLVQFMRQGTILQKRVTSKQKYRFIPRFCYLSQELTRLEIKDQRRKVPESFTKIQHIKSVKFSKSSSQSNRYVFSLFLRDKKVDLMSEDKEICDKWIEGLQLLVQQKHNLFYLLYNVRNAKLSQS